MESESWKNSLVCVKIKESKVTLKKFKKDSLTEAKTKKFEILKIESMTWTKFNPTPWIKQFEIIEFLDE